MNTHDENDQDEWELNFFVIEPSDSRQAIGVADKDHEEYVKLNENVSLLMMHGMGQDAESWLTGYFVGKPLPLKLVDLGYRVVMGNNRGTKFSRNLQISDTASEEYWDFDFTDFGTKDLPAIVHSVDRLFDTPITYIGYDMGNMQLFYGLTQLEDFFFSSHI